MAEFYKVCSLFAGNLYVMPKPGKGDGSVAEDIAALKAEGVDVVVSLLLSDEQLAEGLSTEAELCAASGIDFLNFPIEDHCVPQDREAAMSFVAKLRRSLEDGKNVAIHCRGGVGRTGTLAGALMVSCGYGAEGAFQLLSSVRGKKMPATDAQRAWVAG